MEIITTNVPESGLFSVMHFAKEFKWVSQPLGGFFCKAS
jgi:hypothetical protein